MFIINNVIKLKFILFIYEVKIIKKLKKKRRFLDKKFFVWYNQGIIKMAG